MVKIDRQMHKKEFSGDWILKAVTILALLLFLIPFWTFFALFFDFVVVFLPVIVIAVAAYLLYYVTHRHRKKAA